MFMVNTTKNGFRDDDGHIFAVALNINTCGFNKIKQKKGKIEKWKLLEQF